MQKREGKTKNSRVMVKDKVKIKQNKNSRKAEYNEGQARNTREWKTM